MATNISNNITNSCTWNFEEMRENIEEDYRNSPEATYWKHRANKGIKRIESYRSFRNKADKKQQKRHCINRNAYKKHSKWYGFDDKYMDYETYQYEYNSNVKKTTANNRVYCACCHKSKTLFKSQKQADNFIQFNKETIAAQNGYAPIRSYYCPICGGWHVTSLEDGTWITGKTWAERMLEKMGTLKNQMSNEDKEKREITIESCVQETLSEPQKIETLLVEIKSLFNREMETFFDAYRNQNLDMCKSINSKLKKLFFDLTIEHPQIEKIRKRILSAQDNINILTEKIKKKEDERKSLIWSIQQSFKKDYENFNRAFALRKRAECYNIFFKINDAL